MKELVKKLEQEQAELESKLVKLRAFVGGEDFLIPVNSVQATLLRMQLHSMELYASILEWRIANLLILLFSHLFGKTEQLKTNLLMLTKWLATNFAMPRKW